MKLTESIILTFVSYLQTSGLSIPLICLQNFEFNLGFGKKTSSPKEAGELLMEREYPQILKSGTTPHDVIFIPEVYLYGNATVKVKYLVFI
jgi:hypothetical protein